MRLILIATIGYVLGILWELYLKSSIALILFVITASCTFLIVTYYRKTNYNIKRKCIRYLRVFVNKRNLIRIIICTIFFIFAILYIKNLDKKYEWYSNFFIEKEESFVCTILSDKKESLYQDTYTAKIEYVFNKNIKKKTDFKALIKVKKQNDSINYGDKIICKGEFENPSKRSNYKGFSYEENLKSKQIYGIIKTSYEDIKIIKNNNINIVFRLANKSRKAIIDKVNNLLPNNTKDLVLGFLLGYTDNMEDNLKESFRLASLSHMLAISGAHVSYIIIGITFLLNKMKVKKIVAKIFTIFSLLFFMFLTGFTPSVTRSCTMGIIVLFSEIIFRQKDFACSISLALLIILIYNPFSIYNIGLQLSFGGTIGIVLFSKNINKLIEKIFHNQVKSYNSMIIKQNTTKDYIYKLVIVIEGMLSVTISAQIIIIPITILNFNTVSLTFFISNILAGFFMGIITIGGFTLVFISLISMKIAGVFAIIYNIPLNLLIKIAEFCSKIPGTKLNVITISGVSIIVYYLIILIGNYFYTVAKKDKRNSIENLVIKIKKYITRNKKKTIQIIVILCIIILSIKLCIRSFKGLEIYMVDVGQGDCSVITTPHNKKIIIDGGGSSNQESSYDVGESVVFPYLLDRKISSLDYVIISHFDADHCKGLEYVLKNMRVKTVIIPKQFEDNANYKEIIKISREKKIKVIEVMAGEKIKLDNNVYLYILWPTEKYITENIVNNNSIVCKIVYNNFSALFTGDIEEIAEKEIVNKYKDTKLAGKSILKSNLLKVAHHGSKSSSIEGFLKVVRPEIALIGVGNKNKFGHPNADVLKRLERI